MPRSRIALETGTPSPWVSLEGLLHRFRVGCDPLFQNHFARSIENTVEARPITQIEPDGQLSVLLFSYPP
jgi:hypothetical protein